MATSAFKSTTKRTPIGANKSVENSGSSNGAHRRSRSLSRFSRPQPELEQYFGGNVPTPRGRFVNTIRGSGFPEISLDDLAIELFSQRDDTDEGTSDRGRLTRRLSEISAPSATNLSQQRRGRSVSRQSSRIGEGKGSSNVASGGGRTASDASSRRRRSVSVVRYQISDSESDKDHSQHSSNRANLKSFSTENKQMSLLHESTTPSHRQLGRSLSKRDLSKLQDGYSSQSSALTDDETKDARAGKNVIEKTIRAVYAQKRAEHPIGDDVRNGWYETMRQELRNAVDEIRTELEQGMVRKSSALASGRCSQSDNSDVLQAVSTIRKNYTAKLEQSEKRKQDLLAEILLEERHGHELSKIVKELHPDTKNSTVAEKPLRARKRSNDTNRMSKRLTEEAEKYIEEFLSNVEDTDISSFDGERSDTSSTLDVTKAKDVKLHSSERETFQSPAGCNSLPVEIDGVILPWLQWETSHDGSSHPGKNKRELPVTPKTISWDASQEVISNDQNGHSISSGGSWSPCIDGHFVNNEEDTGSTMQKSEFDMDGYLQLQKEEEILFERWRERRRISSGGLLLCGRGFI